MYESFYTKHLEKARQNGDEIKALCPFHKDHNPSFCVNVKTGKYFCHGCKEKGNAFTFAKKLRIPYSEVPGFDPQYNIKSRPKIVATYNYEDENGNLLFQTVRYEPKDFKQRRPDGNGRWIWNLKGVRLIPYRLPDVIRAQEIFIVEGEKDVETLRDAGFSATTNPLGAGKWRSEFNKYFKGKDIIVLPDNDESGRKHIEQVAQNLFDGAKSLKVVSLPVGKNGDISDYLKTHTLDDLEKLVKTAPEYVPANLESGKQGNAEAIVSSSLWRKLLTEDYVPVGERHNVLTSFAGYLRHRGLGENDIFTILRIANLNCARPLADKELLSIAKSIAKYKAETREWCFEPLSEIIAAAENLTWIIPNWLACGHLTLLTGPPKIGKSVLALNLILALANGGKFLGVDVPKKQVGFVCCEEGAPILKDRIEKMGASFDNVFVHMGPKIIDSASQESLKSFVLDKNIDVLVLDPLVRLHDRKEDSPEAAIPIYLLVELVRETKTAVLLVHHDRKSGGEYGSQIRGSSAIFGAVDLSISLKRFTGNGHLVEVQTIGRICSQTEPIVIELHPQDLLWSPKGTTQDVKFGAEEQLIVDALKAGMSKINEILSFTELPRTTCYRRLKSLENKNLIRNTKNGIWELI